MNELEDMNEQEREVYRLAKAKAMRDLFTKTDGYYGALTEAVANDRAMRAVLLLRRDKREER